VSISFRYFDNHRIDEGAMRKDSGICFSPPFRSFSSHHHPTNTTTPPPHHHHHPTTITTNTVTPPTPSF